jgi:hypothetical protein
MTQFCPRTFVLLAFFFVVFANPVSAQDAKPKWKMETGDVFDIKLTQLTRIQSRVDQRVKEVDNELTLNVTWQVVSASDDGGATVDMTIVSVQMKMASMPNGVGKSMIAQNITHHAVMQGHTALFINAAQMLGDLAAQDGDNALRRRLKHYAHPDLLVIDEVGYLSHGNRHADLLFNIINRRYELKPTIVTTNRPFAEWSEVFPNAACVVSIVDRLVHHSEIIVIEGESYRMREAKERALKKKKSTRSKRRSVTTTKNNTPAGDS